MSAPLVNPKMIEKDPIQGGGNLFTAPTIVAGATAFNLIRDDQGGTGGEYLNAVAGTYGGRLALASTADFSDGDLATLQISYESFGMPGFIDTLANGGLRLYFQDSSGNYSGWSWGGVDLWQGTGAKGTWSAFSPIDNAGTGNIFTIHRSSAPDYSSVTPVNWADITHIEVYVKITSTRSISLFVGRLNSVKIPELVNGEAGDPCTLQNLVDYSGSWPNNLNQRMFDSTGVHFPKILAQVLNVYGVSFGDGVTATRTELISTQLTSHASRAAQESDGALYGSYGVAFNGAGSNRPILVNMTSACYFSAVNVTFSGVQFGGEFYFEFAGVAGLAQSLNGCTFLNGLWFDAQFSQSASCIFDNWEETRLTSSTVLTGFTYRNSPANARGLVFSGAAGDYSAVTGTFAATNAGVDVTLVPSDSNAWDLRGLEIESGHTLTINNETLTASTVILSREIFDAGDYQLAVGSGPVTVQGVPQTAGVSIAAWVNGVVWLYNDTTGAPVEEVSTTGAGYTKTWANGTNASAGDQLTAYFICEGFLDDSVTFIATADTTQTLIRTLEADTVYSYFSTFRGKNGYDVVAENVFALDGVNVQFDIDDPDNVYSLMDLYLWYKVSRLVNPGAIQLFFGAVTAQDTATLWIENTVVNAFFDNVTPRPFVYNAAENVSIRRRDLAYPVVYPTSGGGSITVNTQDIQIASQDLELLKVRFDLSDNTTQKYANDGSQITSSSFTLTKTDNGDGTFSMVKT